MLCIMTAVVDVDYCCPASEAVVAICPEGTVAWYRTTGRVADIAKSTSSISSVCLMRGI